VSINFTDNILNNSKKIELTISYPDHVLIPKSLSEKSLSIYKKDTLTKLNSTVNLDLNQVSALINESGEFVVASTDLTPRINNITVEPEATNIPNANVFISAGITDDGSILGVNVSLGNQTGAMVFNPLTGLFETNITGPGISGRHAVVIEAADDTDNTASQQSSFVLDLDPPVIRIISPENISHVTNRIELRYFVDEKSNQSFSVDGGAVTPVNNTAPFQVEIVALTLSAGNHSITVFASDVFDNNGSERVDFEIESQNIRVSDLEVPIFEKPNRPVSFSANVTNTLINPANNVEVQLLVNSNVSDTRLFNISGETSLVVEFPFVLNEGKFNISINAVPLPEERVTEDNILSKDILITDKVPLLLVDDDTNTSDAVYRDAILAAGGLGYDFIPFDVSERGPPGLELMNQFPLVVWFSGGDITLTPIERENLQAYMNNRGYLLIFSNNLGRDIGDTDFYENFLFAEFRREGISQTVEGVFRDPIGNGLLFSLLETGDEIKPILPATESMRYSGGESAAIKGDNGLFKTVYFAFGLEDIPDGATRNIIMDRTLNFFDIDIVPPVMSNKVPLEGSTFPINTTNTILSLQTDEIAECRLSNITNEFDQMDAFDNTNSLSHSTLAANLTNGKNFTFFINCRDVFNNQNNTETFDFFIHNRTFLPPVVEQIPDKTVLENELISIPVNVTDPEDDPLIITISDREIFGFVPIASRFSLVNQTFELQTNFDDAGRYNLRVAVFDGFDTVITDFVLTIINVNRPPVLTPIGNKVILEDTFFFLDVQAQDPDGDDVIFSDNTSLFDINPSNGVITFTPKNFQVGDHYINISVTDGELIDFEVVLFRVTNSNDPPQLDSIPSQTAQEGSLFTVQINATDLDGDPLTFTDDTDIFNISSSGLINFTPTNADVGTHFINITVTDSLDSDTRILNLVVEEFNVPPIITSILDLITVLINQTLEINVTACDPDLDPGCV